MKKNIATIISTSIMSMIINLLRNDFSSIHLYSYHKNYIIKII